MSEECPAIECCPSQIFTSAPSVPSTTYYNTEQCYTASCPSGQTGDDVTACVAAGTVSSLISVSDANATAMAQAVNEANAALDCSGDADCVDWMPLMASATQDGFTVAVDSGSERIGYESWRMFDGTGSFVPFPSPIIKGIKVACPYDTTMWGLRIYVGDALDGETCKLTLHGLSDLSLFGPPLSCDDIIFTNYSFTGNKVAGTLIQLPVPHTNRGWHFFIFQDNAPNYTQDILQVEFFACEPAPIPT